MAKIFDAVQRFRKIEEVTSPKDDVPPVYLMDEVVELAKESPDAAASVAEHIQRNLGNRNPIVKWKALKLIRHLLTKGCSQFQRSMQRYSGSIRELVSFKGEPDPFKGDALNQRVRETAQEVMQLLYAHQPQQGPVQGVSLQGRIQGFGSSSAPPPSNNNTGVAGVAAGLTSWAATGVSRMMAFGSNTAGGGTGGGGQEGGRAGFMGNLQTAGSGGHNRTGSLGEPVLGGARTHVPGSFGPVGSFGPPPGSTPQYTPHHAPAPAAATTGSVFRGSGGGLASEEALVDNMCAGGGLRPVPSADDLAVFVNAVSASDGLKIAELMLAKLTSDKWQVVLRTLCALEAILNQGLTQACGEVAVMFQSDPTPVQAAITNTNAQVRQQAAKCLKLLTGEEVDVSSGLPANTRTAAAATPTPLPPPPAPASPLDLLGDLGDDLPRVSQHTTTAVSTPAAPPPAAVTAAQDPFALMDALHPPIPAAAAPAATPHYAASLGAVSAAPAPAHAQPPPAAAARPALDDLFSDFTSAPAASPPVGVPGFSGLSVSAVPQVGSGGVGLGLGGGAGGGAAGGFMQPQQQAVTPGGAGAGGGWDLGGGMMAGIGGGAGGAQPAVGGASWAMPGGGLGVMGGGGGGGGLVGGGVGGLLGGGQLGGGGGIGQPMRPGQAPLNKPAADSFDFVKSAFK